METFDTSLTAFFHWLLRATLQGSLLLCLILLIKITLREKLPARWHYCLWLVLLLRLSLPWTPASRLSMYNLIPRSLPSPHASPAPTGDAHLGAADGKAPVPGQNQDVGSALVPAKGEELAQGQGGASTVANGQSSHGRLGVSRHPFAAVVGVVPWLWLGGCLALGGYTLLRAVGLWWGVRLERPVTDQQILDLLEDGKLQMRIRTLVGVVVTDKARSPALFGFVRPRILLPQGLIETLGLDDLHYVFLHELAHLKRRDIYLAWLVCLLQVLHWFNPLLWYAFRRMRADQEMAADALALSATGTDESLRYGQTVVNLLERFSRPQHLPSLAGILESPSHIERRIAMITQFKDSSYRWSPLAVALVIALGCASLPDARSGKTGQPAAAKSAGAPTSSAPSAAAPAVDSNVFVDPNIGIRFTKFKALSGSSDVDKDWHPSPSPNRKFLLSNTRVIPLDGGDPLDLVDIPGAYGPSWSPDGRNVMVRAGAVWLVRVNPETARPVGAPRELLKKDCMRRARWSSDSKRIIFERRDDQIHDEVWTLSIETGAMSKVIDPFDFGFTSPDGRMIACAEGLGVMYPPTLMVKPVAGGEVKTIKGIYPIAWSADSKWLVCKPIVDGGWKDTIRFIRLADGRDVEVEAPGFMITPSAQGGKLVFFHCSYNVQTVLKVISVAGGEPTEFGWPNMSFRSATYQSWASDSRSIVVQGERKGSAWGFWAISLDGKEPRPLALDTPPCPPSRRNNAWLFSPDGSKLLLMAENKRAGFDLWVMPTSLSEMRSTGPAVKVFDGYYPAQWVWTMDGNYWSADGTKIVFTHRGNIWTASADGKTVIQLTKKPPQDSSADCWPDWSPDGTTIAFCTVGWSKANVPVRIVPASGGEPRLITELHPGPYPEPRSYAWSPDGKELTIASDRDGIISNFPISGGDARVVLRTEDMGISGRIGWLRWSPDGHALGFAGVEKGEYRIYIYQPSNGKLERLAPTSQATGSRPWYWSSDSKWVSFFAEQVVKTRPESILWEMDVEEAIAKLAK